MTEVISSSDNKFVKHISKIINSSKYRKNCKEFAIEGLRLCEDAFLSGVKVTFLVYTEKAFFKYKEFILSVAKQCEKSYVVSEKIMGKVCSTETPQGIVCVCKQRHQEFSLNFAESDDQTKKILLLENVQDPSNLGTILRTAEALGIGAVILTEGCCDIYSPKVLRGSMGAVFRLNMFFSENIEETIRYLKSNNINIYATVPSKLATDVTNVNFSKSCAVAIGNEGNGLRKETIAICDEKITIPMLGRAESLNVSIASGIIMWEMMRRR